MPVDGGHSSLFLSSMYGAQKPASSDGASSHRKTVLRRLTQLRGANAGRRREQCGRLNSCEAALVGGNRHLESSPPAEVWFTEGGPATLMTIHKHKKKS